MTPSLENLLSIATVRAQSMIGPASHVGVHALRCVGLAGVRFVDQDGMNPIFGRGGMRIEFDSVTREFTLLEEVEN